MGKLKVFFFFVIFCVRPVNGNYAAGGNVAKAPHNPALLANGLRGRESHLTAVMMISCSIY